MHQKGIGRKCPIRIGESCTLCFPGAQGPRDCGLVYLVQSDPEMREQLAERRRDRRLPVPA